MASQPAACVSGTSVTPSHRGQRAGSAILSKELQMLDLLDAVFSAGTLYKRYGIKGCLLVVLGLVILFAIIAFFAFQPAG
jgi:hypothetical protein